MPPKEEKSLVREIVHRVRSQRHVDAWNRDHGSYKQVSESSLAFQRTLGALNAEANAASYAQATATAGSGQSSGPRLQFVSHFESNEERTAAFDTLIEGFRELQIFALCPLNDEQDEEVRQVTREIHASIKFLNHSRRWYDENPDKLSCIRNPNSEYPGEIGKFLTKQAGKLGELQSRLEEAKGCEMDAEPERKEGWAERLASWAGI